jgi:hypothetical protein
VELSLSSDDVESRMGDHSPHQHTKGRALMTRIICGWAGCNNVAVAQMRQTVGRQQILPVCHICKTRTEQAWAKNVPSGRRVFQIMEPLARKAVR